MSRERLTATATAREQQGGKLTEGLDSDADSVPDPLVERAIRLFTFLGQSQQLRSPRVYDVDSYTREGSVLWFRDLPAHPAVRVPGTTDPGEPLLSVDRVPRVDPPEPDPEIAAWLDDTVVDADREPVLRTERCRAADGAEPATVIRLDDHPQVSEEFRRYLDVWRVWAEGHRRDEPVRTLYGDLFSTYVAAIGHPEELELVVGSGLLTWRPEQHPAVRRHALTTTASISFDDANGRLSIAVADSPGPTRVELDMLDPGLIGNAPLVNAVREDVVESRDHPLDRDRAGEFARRLVHLLAHDAEYRDEDGPPQAATHPVGAFAPALILRRRTQQGLVEIFRRIVGQISAAGVVPDGIRPLVDPGHVPDASTGGEHTDGAVVRVDDEPFLPLPVNEVQLKILQRVDTHAQTLIQGPPGTGKTHTAAVLISHLLARGKRVLITAHTDRALKEVRAKLPEPIRPLAVSVVGASREDMSDLRLAVERIASAASEHDPAAAAREVAGHLGAIDELHRRRASLHNELLDAREREVRDHEVAGYRGTLAAMALNRDAERDRHGWIGELVGSPAGPPPVTDATVTAWHRQLLDRELIADEPQAARPLVAVDDLVDPGRFADLTAVEEHAVEHATRFERLRDHPAYHEVHRLTDPERDALEARLRGLVQELRALGQWREPWMRAALDDVLRGRSATWMARRADMGRLAGQAGIVVGGLGPAVDVRVDGDTGGLEHQAAELAEHLGSGGTVRLGANGAPRIGPLTARPVKQAAPLFQRVRVDGSAPVTTRQLRAFLSWLEGSRLVAALDRAWPAGVVIPDEDTLHERLHWHRTELGRLDRLLGLAGELQREEQRLAAAGVSRPHWPDPTDVTAYVGLPEAARAADAATAASLVLDELAERVEQVRRRPDVGPVVTDLLDAVRRRDHAAYSVALRRLDRLHLVRTQVTTRDETTRILESAAPGLAAAVVGDPADPVWDERLAGFEQAWNWAVAGAWIAGADAPDVNALQSAINLTDDRIRDHVQQLAAVRAWSHAVAPGRLTRGSRASLEQYVQLVRQFGRTGGRYRTERQAEIRDAMDRCRPAVPVWIMPLYRIADQFRIARDMFDVVVVDEASQAGLEASFLQYLAPRIVVIGDDRQVSPAAVGVNQQQLRDLGNQYLYDDDLRATWQDPQRSLFDEARIRFSGMLTLVEHHRCAPEIISFSNRIAYEPDGVRLIPIRQLGADRLEPVRPVLVNDGYEQGSSTTRTNPPEIDAVITRIEKCIADPRYDGLTFGVISLLGTAQAKAIEKRLLETIAPEEWTARDLRCGDAADFQGSERDVMFLTMVAAPRADRRLTALTGAQHVQRYNVAASRAKDQMWVFHSVRLDQLGNAEDMRFQLLDHCYGIQRRTVDDETAVASTVPEDVPIPPFDSLFEQRVCNRLLDRGYSVVPQFPALGYRIDLVVCGATTRLAIECDGDHWHGPEAYRHDMARQRELERCGWNFVRVLESEFYLDPDRALAPVWSRLDDHGIRPARRAAPDTAPRGYDAVDKLPAGTAVEENTEDEDERVVAVTEFPDTVVEADSPERSPTTDDSAIPYPSFTGSLPPVDPTSPAGLVDGLVEIVAVEGPILGHRLHSVYVRSSGGARVGSQIARALNSAITRAVRRGLLVRDDPLRESGVKPGTFRLPGQPAAIARERGPRTFDQIPPAELALVMRSVADEIGWGDTHALYRATIARYGFNQVGSAIRTRLDAVARLTVRDDP